MPDDSPTGPAAAAAPPGRRAPGHGVCGRAAFHGTSAVLTAYMVGWLLYDARDARANYHAFLAAACLAQLLGGWIADRFPGRGRAVLWISLLAVAGHAALAAWPSRTGLAVGLGLVALGAGGLRPVGPATMAGLIGPDEPASPARGPGWPLLVAGLGLAAARLLVPGLLRAGTPALAFAVPGLLMACAVALRAVRGAVPPAPSAAQRPDGFLRVTWRAVRRLGTGRPGEHWLDAARDRHPAEAVEGTKSVFRVLGVLAVVPLFWSLFEQTGSSWVLQARAMGLEVGGWSLEPSQLQAAGPLFAVALVPLLTRVVLPWLARRGRVSTPLQQVSAGLFATALSFVAAAAVQRLVDLGHPPHALWQLPQYFLLAVGEVLVALIGLEFAHAQAPRAMRRTITSLWLVAMAVGNLVTWLLNRLVGLEGAAYFLLFAGLMLAAALAFRVVAGRCRGAPVT